MSSDLLLRARNISKVYTGSVHPFSTLCHALFGTANDAADVYPVLADINIDIVSGETVGIMGRNGAGKTTLLGILGSVIQPTTGTVERYGRIATLLGLTAGFNMNFSGRENAYLFCSIQGLTRAQIDDQIDHIRNFADLGRHFDLPLRTYSSGMQARLAFACAVHVQADLIIIDETLAVGDANFRMKCYDRIRQMKESGQTFLMVSHNQNLVANFCTRGIVLEGGNKIFDGATFEAVEIYKRIRTESMGDDVVQGRVLKQAVAGASLPNEAVLDNFTLTEGGLPGSGRWAVRARLKTTRQLELLTINFGLSNSNGIVVCALDGGRYGFQLSKVQATEEYFLTMEFDRRLLPGRYYFSCIVYELIGDVSRPQSMYQNVLMFDVVGSNAVSGIADLHLHVSVLNNDCVPE